MLIPAGPLRWSIFRAGGGVIGLTCGHVYSTYVRRCDTVYQTNLQNLNGHAQFA